MKVYQIHPVDDPGNMLRMTVRNQKVYVIEPVNTAALESIPI